MACSRAALVIIVAFSRRLLLLRLLLRPLLLLLHLHLHLRLRLPPLLLLAPLVSLLLLRLQASLVVGQPPATELSLLALHLPRSPRPPTHHHLLALDDRALCQIGDDRCRELLRCRAARLTQRDELPYGPLLDDDPLVARRRTEVPDAPGGVLLGEPPSQSEQEEEGGDAAGCDDRPLHLLISVREVTQRRRRLLLHPADDEPCALGDTIAEPASAPLRRRASSPRRGPSRR